MRGQLCETIGKTTGQSSAISDRDTVIAASGVQRREILEKRMSSELEDIMESRQLYRYKVGDRQIPVCEEGTVFVSTAAPIITEGDVSGCVLFILGDDKTPAGETECKLAQTIAAFLGKQMEA